MSSTPGHELLGGNKRSCSTNAAAFESPPCSDWSRGSNTAATPACVGRASSAKHSGSPPRTVSHALAAFFDRRASPLPASAASEPFPLSRGGVVRASTSRTRCASRHFTGGRPSRHCTACASQYGGHVAFVAGKARTKPANRGDLLRRRSISRRSSGRAHALHTHSSGSASSGSSHAAATCGSTATTTSQPSSSCPSPSELFCQSLTQAAAQRWRQAGTGQDVSQR